MRLDTIRGVAIAWVMALHICGACWGWDYRHWSDGLSLAGQTLVKVFSLGRLGVPMFFVLSGFLIHYTFQRSNDRSIRTFWLRRFGRIYPPYFVALVVFAVVQGCLWTRHGRNDLLNHALFVHTFKNEQFFSINSSFWSLAHEFQFYLLYPGLLLVQRLVGMRTLLFGSLGLRLAIDALTMSLALENNLVVRMMLPKLYFEWILGMYVADCFVRQQRAFGWPAAVGWCCACAALLTAERGWLELATVPAISLATAMWIERIVHVGGQPSVFDKALAPLGLISYSLYLWHQPIVNELCPRIVQSVRGQNLIGMTGLTMIAAAVCIVCCVLIAKGAYEWIEAPCMQLTKRLAAKRTFPVVGLRRAA